jgi:four helix bundle protein
LGLTYPVVDKYDLQTRLKKFAFRVVQLSEALPRNQLGRYFQNQIIRSAFSAAANYRAACIAQSRAAFVAKLSIAFEESDESVFWLECIKEANLFDPAKLISITQEATELSKILAASRKSSQ